MEAEIPELIVEDRGIIQNLRMTHGANSRAVAAAYIDPKVHKRSACLARGD